VCDDVIVPDILLEADDAGVPVLLTELLPVFVSVTLEVLLLDKTAVPVTEPDDVLELVVVVEWVRVFVWQDDGVVVPLWLAETVDVVDDVWLLDGQLEALFTSEIVTDGLGLVDSVAWFDFDASGDADTDDDGFGEDDNEPLLVSE